MPLPPGLLQPHRKILWSSCRGPNRRLQPQPCWSHCPSDDEGAKPLRGLPPGAEKVPGACREQWLEPSYLLFQLVPQKSILCARGNPVGSQGLQPGSAWGRGTRVRRNGQGGDGEPQPGPRLQPDKHRTCHPDGWQLGSRQVGHTEGASWGHRQPAVTSQRGHTQTEGRDWGKGPIGCTREGARGDKGCQAGRQTDRGSQANRQVASQADTQRDRQPEGQANRQTAVWLAVTSREEPANSRTPSLWVTRQRGTSGSVRVWLPPLPRRPRVQGGRKRRMW